LIQATVFETEDRRCVYPEGELNLNGHNSPLADSLKGETLTRAAKRVIVTGAAGAPALNYIRSLRAAPEPFHLVGVDCSKYQLLTAKTDERYLVPRASDPAYIPVIVDIIKQTDAEFLFAQPDVEVAVLSQRRDELPVKTYMPAAETVALCQDKFASFERWQAAGLPVPETQRLQNVDDLRSAMADFGDVWLRAVEGAAGRGALRTSDFDQALKWIESHHGWGKFSAARYLSPVSVTWQSIWHDGELIVAQGRERLNWEFADRAPSGVTGITGTGLTVCDSQVDEIAQAAIRAVDMRPHGIFAVDMTRDASGVPNPTEINIARFFTTTYFFTAAGLNMPYIFTKLAFGESPALPDRRINPLPPGLLWIRGMDREPTLADVASVARVETDLADRVRRVRVHLT
jgi:carbamoyl-phosphate synthase large subunit